MFGDWLKKDKKLILKLVSLSVSLAALPATIAMFKNGDFALIPLQQPSDIFLMCDKNHKSNSDSEDSIKVLRFIKDHKYKNREC